MYNKSNIDGVKVIGLSPQRDERGWLIEGFRKDSIDVNPEMMYASLTYPKETRGPHEHVKQTDVFVFVGPGLFELKLWKKIDGIIRHEIHICGDGMPTLVIIPPGVIHGYRNISDKSGLVINMPDKLYRGHMKSEEVDEIRHEINPNSEYRM